MPDVLLLCTDDALNQMVREALEPLSGFELTVLKTRTMGIQYLNYELPEINILYWNDRVIDMAALVEEIRKDPWLHYGACLFIHDSAADADRIRKLKDINLLTNMERDRVQYYLPRVFKILAKYPNLLSQWNFSALIRSNLEGRFELERDAFDMVTHANLLGNFLVNANLIGVFEKEVLLTTLLERLMWLVEHDQGRSRGKIFLEYRIGETASTFRLYTEDSSFVWNRSGPSNALPKFLSAATEEGGRVLVLTVAHVKTLGALVPNIFDAQRQEHFQVGDVVFRQGEESSHLYFIVSGEYEVLANDKRVTTLGPWDVFLGEMSFLLKNRRTATVRAITSGTLIKISKQEYIQALKERPHYAFFLARMLAERLAKVHQNRL